MQSALYVITRPSHWRISKKQLNKDNAIFTVQQSHPSSFCEISSWGARYGFPLSGGASNKGGMGKPAIF